MIMMSYSWRWSSLQLTGQADFWQPTRTGDRAGVEDRLAQASPRALLLPPVWGYPGRYRFYGTCFYRRQNVPDEAEGSAGTRECQQQPTRRTR